MPGFLTVRSALLQGTKLLEEGSVPAARLTAEVLLSHALKRDRTYLFGHPEEPLTEAAWIHYGRYLFQRTGGRPTQYITRRQEFYGRDFLVTPDVLIPRPETEHLVEIALRYLEPGVRVADVGCGSGAIAVSLALEAGIPVVATDLSAGALRVAACNARSLGAAVSFVQGDLLTPFSDRRFDVVVSNPPYIRESAAESLPREVQDFEPHLALFAGMEGTSVYRRLAADCKRVLRPGGRLIMELGHDSLESVRDILGDPWIEVCSEPDLAGIPRVISARLGQ